MPARKPQRLAFLLGNSRYEHLRSLPNPERDVEAMAAALQAIGFTVYMRKDLDKDSTVGYFQEFLDRHVDRTPRPGGDIEEADCVVIHYSGHGVQIASGADLVNYIVPIDFTADGDVTGLVPVQTLAAAIPRHIVKTIFLDCCRDTGGITPEGLAVDLRLTSPPSVPAVKAVSALADIPGRGLAPRRPKPLNEYGDRTFMAFAAAPGEFASDGESSLGPFTGALVGHLGLRGLDVFDLAQYVAKLVRDKTKGEQVPWVSANFADRFCFVNPPGARDVALFAGMTALTGALSGFLTFGGLRFLSEALGTCSNGCATSGPSLEPLEGWRLLFLLTSLPLGLVLGYGVWRWGEKRLILAVGAALAYLVMASAWRYWLFGYQVGLFEHYDKVKELQAGPWHLFDDSSSMVLFLFALLVCGGIGAATVLAGQLMLPRMRSLPRIALGALLGAGAAPLFFLYVYAAPLRQQNPADIEHSFNFHIFAYSLIVLCGAVWEGLIGLNAGWAYRSHRPQYEQPRASWWRNLWLGH